MDIEKEILNFKQSISNYSVEELEKLSNEIKDQIGKMIFDSGLILKASVVTTLIEEKKREQK